MTDQSPLQQINPEHLQTLYEITQTMNSSLDFNVVLNNVIDSVMHVTRAQRGFLLIDDLGTGDLRVQVARGVEGDLKDENTYSTTIVKEVVETRKTLLTNNAIYHASSDSDVGKSIIVHGLRAVLCAPMMVQDRLIGVVYVDTTFKAGMFNPSDRDLMAAVAGQAGVAIENARLYRVAVEKGRIEQELKMARGIQESLLPRNMPHMTNYDMAAHWQAAREMAGDFYDAFIVNDDRLSVIVADVSDKGAPAALFMAVARSMLRGNIHATEQSVEALRRTNDLILDDADSGMFVTVYQSTYFEDGRSQHVNAGHNPPLIYRRAEGTLTFMPRGGRALGWFPDNPLEAVDIQMHPGDMLIYYTDGVTEAENLEGGFFGEDRLIEAIREAAERPVDELLQHIVKRVNDFCAGAPPFDDLTLFVVRYTG